MEPLKRIRLIRPPKPVPSKKPLTRSDMQRIIAVLTNREHTEVLLEDVCQDDPSSWSVVGFLDECQQALEDHMRESFSGF